MAEMNAEIFLNAVHGQIELLRAGKPLDAIDQYFAVDGVMYANGKLFAEGAQSARETQEPFMASAREIDGKIIDLKIAETSQVCVFRNQTSFTDKDGKRHQIDGMCWQKWSAGKVAEEQYFQGNMMVQLISEGLLADPTMLKTKTSVGN